MTKHANQYELETHMRDQGSVSYMKLVDAAKDTGNESNTDYGVKLISHHIDAVSSYLTDELNDIQGSGDTRRYGVALKYLREVDPQVSALIALKGCIDGLTLVPSLTALAIQIGSKIEDEIRFQRLKEKSPGMFYNLKKQTEGATSHRHRRTVYVYNMKKAGLDEEGWTSQIKTHVGMKLINIIQEVTGLIKVRSIPKRNNLVYHVFPTDELVEWVEKHINRSSLMSPKHLPCIEPPIPWLNIYGGGYHYPELTGYLPLVKARNKQHTEILKNSVSDLGPVLSAVNAMQATAWEVNSSVLEVVEEVWNTGGGRLGLPERDNMELPPKPSNIDDDIDVLRDWKSKASKVHEHNNRLKAKRIEAAKILWIAKEFNQYEEIYFPYQLDFRGRAYAVPMYLNPQGSDIAKGLLRFKEAIPLACEESVKYLAAHGANCFGYDKASLDDKVGFIDDLTQQIIEAAENPLDVTWWMEADEPLCFLAFCFEWAGYQREGLAFQSQLSIAMDATCSGIQHFSAMSRDEEGGRSVNLLPSDTKEDIYQRVCDVFIQRLESLLDSDKLLFEYNERPYLEGEMAKWWLELKPDRSTTKRQVMVLPYGATLYSCREYTEAWIDEYRKDEYHWPENYMRVVTQWAATLIWKSIEDVVTGARETMGWLQQCVDVACTAESDGVQWSTPTGFIVHQKYPNMKKCGVKTVLGDSKIWLYLRRDIDTINRTRMKSSISPNFVHSMDAAHLTLSINAAFDAGISSFSMIHDSFGTHAARTPEFAQILREQFVKMYSENDVLAAFHNSISESLPEDVRDQLPQVISKGDLDLELVKESEFFFS